MVVDSIRRGALLGLACGVTCGFISFIVGAIPGALLGFILGLVCGGISGMLMSTITQAFYTPLMRAKLFEYQLVTFGVWLFVWFSLTYIVLAFLFPVSVGDTNIAFIFALFSIPAAFDGTKKVTEKYFKEHGFDSPAPISGPEWRAVWIISILVAAVTLIPVLLGYASQTDEWRYSGAVFGAQDAYSYLGKMRLGARGLWDFHLFYTVELHNSAPLLFLPYIAPGHIARLLGVTPENPNLPTVLNIIQHTLRFFCNIIYLVVLYRFIAAFVRGQSLRWLAWWLAVFGGGLGLLALAYGQQPPEFYIPEGFSWLILLSLPHLALARAAMLGGFLLLFSAKPNKLHELRDLSGLRNAQLAGLLWCVVGLMVPFFLTVIYAVLGAWGLAVWVRRRKFPLDLFLSALVAGGITLPLFAYFAYTFTSNPAFAAWSAQNQLPSPPPWVYLLAYVVLAIPAFWGAQRAWALARHNERWALLVGWVIAAPVLVYLPINVQRRLSEGVIVPLAILAVMGLHAWARGRNRRLRARQQRWNRGRLVLAVLGSLSSLLLTLGIIISVRRPSPPLFRHTPELAAFQWLNENAPDESVVLTEPENGNALPAYADVRPLTGHGPETIDWVEKERLVTQYFSGGMTSEERAALYERYSIDYVMESTFTFGIDAIGSFCFECQEDLTLVFEEGQYRVYQVNDGS